MNNKEKIYNFLDSQKHAVIATVNMKGNPQAATIGFGQTEDLVLIFGTNMTTRKAANLSHDNLVAVVVNGPESALQYEGRAALLKGNELLVMQEIFFKKNPGMEKYSHLKSQIYYKIEPLWIRYTDHSFSPGKVFEIDFT